MINENDTNNIKARLEQEEATLELELTDIGHIHNAASGNWDGTAGNLEAGTEDQNIYADKVEEELTNESVVNELELRLKNVKRALEKIKEGSYGTCDKCGEEIDADRIEANPAAVLCFKCAEQE